MANKIITNNIVNNNSKSSANLNDGSSTIGNLPDGGDLTQNDIVPIVRDGANYKAKYVPTVAGSNSSCSLITLANDVSLSIPTNTPVNVIFNQIENLGNTGITLDQATGFVTLPANGSFKLQLSPQLANYVLIKGLMATFSIQSGTPTIYKFTAPDVLSVSASSGTASVPVAYGIVQTGTEDIVLTATIQTYSGDGNIGVDLLAAGTALLITRLA